MLIPAGCTAPAHRNLLSHLLMTACFLTLFHLRFHTPNGILLHFRMTVNNLWEWASASPSPSAPHGAQAYILTADMKQLQR